MHVAVGHGLATDNLPIQECQARAHYADTKHSCRLAGEEARLKRDNLGFFGEGFAAFVLACLFEAQEPGQGIPGCACPECAQINAIAQARQAQPAKQARISCAVHGNLLEMQNLRWQPSSQRQRHCGAQVLSRERWLRATREK
jgi:hypothetical protein